MTFDPTKPVQTRDGRPARILCVDAKISKTAPIVALVDRPGEDGELLDFYDADGRASCSISGGNDLVNVPQTVGRWIHLYRYVANGEYFASDRQMHGLRLQDPASFEHVSSEFVRFTLGKCVVGEAQL